MSISENSQGTPVGQAENIEQLQFFTNLIVQTLARLIGPSAPAIMAGGLYTSDQVETNMGMSPHTLAAWRDHNGLVGMKPGTAKFYYRGEDIIEFCRAHADGNVIVPKTAMEKAKLRKQKKK